jgi:signal transduction histidine kinase
MSLRTRIILLFATALILTLAVSSFLGGRIAERALERSLRDRTVDLARTIADELALSPRSDPARAARQLGVILTRHRGIRSAQLVLRHGKETRSTRVTFGEEGTIFDISSDPEASIPTRTEVALVEDAHGRCWRVELPLSEGSRHAFGALRIEAGLSQAEEIATRERSVFFAVAGTGAALLAAVFSFILGRWLTRPLTRLAGAMAAVASGSIDETAVPGTARGDEVGVVARGLSGMLARIRRFNGELQAKVDEAVAGVAAKNRELAEVNGLLVEARRDLTTKERLAALGQISGTIAHELGNPLNAISGHIQLLARDPASAPELRSGLQTVEREVKRMTAIIRRFLDSARALAPVPEDVDMAALLEEAVTLSLSVDALARIEVHREVTDEAAHVRADPGLLRHVLGNLIANAVDAMPSGGILTVRASREGGAIAVAVDDTGVGIRPEDRRRLFEPFFTTKPRGKGTGLGLSISREIASALRGRIEVESIPGQGSRFTLTFPEMPAAPRAAGAADGAIAHSRGG